VCNTTGGNQICVTRVVKTFRIRTYLLMGVWSLVVSGCVAIAESSEVGVLILAHGAGPEWNGQVQKAVEEAKIPYPTEIAFGMGMMPQEVENIQKAVQRLESQGIRRIRAIPLLVSSYSSVYRQYEYLLGLRPEPSWPHHPVNPVKLQADVRMGRALDDSSLVAQVLLERALGLSKEPAKEAVLLVGHGPEEDPDNEKWLAAMQSLGDRVQREGRFAAIAAATLRDDAPAAVKEEAIRRLRSQAVSLSKSYRVLVVPLLMSKNGIEQKIAHALEGLPAVYTGEALLPHANISRWIREQVE